MALYKITDYVSKTANALTDYFLVDEGAGAYKKTGYGDLLAQLKDGWYWLTSVAPTISDIDVNYAKFTFANVDISTKLTLGDTFKWTQNSIVKMGFIHKITYSAPNTVIEVWGGTDYTPLNSTTYPVTGVYFGTKWSLGFPKDPTKWCITYTDATVTTITPVGNGTIYNPNSNAITLPIGNWNIQFSNRTYTYYHATTTFSGIVENALSEANNSFTNVIGYNYIMRRSFILDGAVQRIQENASGIINKYTVTSKKTLYFVYSYSVSEGSPSHFFSEGVSNRPINITAISAYL